MFQAMITQKKKLRNLNYARIESLENEITDLKWQLVIHEEEGTRGSFEIHGLKTKK